jgi:hypothetical protein
MCIYKDSIVGIREELYYRTKTNKSYDAIKQTYEIMAALKKEKISAIKKSDKHKYTLKKRGEKEKHNGH